MAKPKTIREKIEKILDKFFYNTIRFDDAVSQIEKLIEVETDEAFADGVGHGLETLDDENKLNK